MGRVDKFREIRKSRRKLRLSILLFFILVIPGICISDYSINSLMKNENRIELISLEKEMGSLYQLDMLNLKMYIDTEYVQEDYKRVKNAVAGILGMK